MNNQEIAKKVIDALGGRENVNSVAHCATRLRVMVKDEEKINKEVIENLEKVQGAFFNSGQYQIIFGTGTVNKMYDEVVVLGLPTSSKDDMKAEVAKQGNWFQRAIRTFGDVFVPIIPVIVATGLFMGVRGLFNALEMPLPGDFATYTQILTDTAFIILPGLVVWSTFRVFGGNPAVGIVLGMMLVSGSLPNAWAVAQGGEVTAMNFFGFIPVVGLQGSVLPAFIIGVVGAKFEKAVRKVVPDVIDLLVTPFVTLLVMSILGLFVIGPVFHVVENYILIATKAILSMPFGLGGFLIGGVHQLIVVSGVHHIFNLLEVQLLAADHANPFNAIITAAMTAQGAATVAVGVKTKNPKLKTLAFPAALSAFLGITEPALFGVNLKYKFPFFCALAGSAIGAFVAGLTHVIAVSLGAAGFIGFLSIKAGSIPMYIIAEIMSFVAAFAFTYFYGKTKAASVFADEAATATAETVTEPTVEAPVVEETDTLQNETLVTPIVGDVVALADVNDPVFSSGAMGQGIAVKPSQGVVYAPADAEVSIAFPTGHAFGLKTRNGAEVLIHVGIDTVSMNGDGFEAKVAQGNKVKAGDVLGTFDSNKIAAAGLDDTTMVIVTNTADYASVAPVATGSVAKGDAVIEVKI